MIYDRRYVQFNDLVIDGYDMISTTESDQSFKYISHERTYGHGNYAPFKADYVFTNESTVSIDLRLHVKKLPCDKRPLYRQLAISELSKPGKLWAVQNNELVWAYAVMTNMGEMHNYLSDTLVFSIDFTLPEGLWHKADKQKTFLQDYDVCNFMDCFPFKEYDPCKGSNCCDCANPVDLGCECCICDDICREMALCLNKERLQSAYNDCDGGVDFHIVYDCLKGQEFFGDYYMGQKFCTGENCSGIIAGVVYADTDIPTTDYSITLHGELIDPAITINGNTNIIKGDFSEYEGIMTIKSNGEVYYRQGDCCEDMLVDASAWEIPGGMDYGWTFYPGNNRLVVETNTCCGVNCAYVDIDGITI